VSVFDQIYVKARNHLAPHRKEERLMRFVEREAIRFGRREQHRRWVQELRGKGWTELATYFGRLLDPNPPTTKRKGRKP
jgi:hypothetical protein